MSGTAPSTVTRTSNAAAVRVAKRGGSMPRMPMPAAGTGHVNVLNVSQPDGFPGRQRSTASIVNTGRDVTATCAGPQQRNARLTTGHTNKTNKEHEMEIQRIVTETSTDGLLAGLLGENVFVRTITYHYTGRLIAFDGATMRLADAAWIAASGRFADALTSGEFSEVEPYPGDVFLNAAAVVDVSVWGHDLPRTQQ